MIEVVATEIKTADQSAHGTVLGIDSHKRCLHLGNLRDQPLTLAVPLDADDRAAP